MLRIDRVRTEMHLVPSLPAAEPGGESSSTRLDAEDLRPIVLQILRDELRALERRGTL